MIKFGILGAGNIARRFAASLSHMKNASLEAVSCRTVSKGAYFQEQFGAEKVYGSHDELLSDEAVDAIYLALPHHLHCEWAIKAIEAGKAVLCEKPATMSVEEMQSIIDAAHRHNVFFMEAMKPRFTPAYQVLRQEIANGTIGEILSLKASMCDGSNGFLQGTYHSDPVSGGALYDCGIYVVSYLEEFGRELQNVEIKDANVQNDVILYVDAAVNFSNIQTELECGFDRDRPRQAVIHGTKGDIILPNFHRPEKLEIHHRDGSVSTREVPYEVDDFYGEIKVFVDCLKEGKSECPVMPLAASLRCAEILAKIKISLK